MKKIKKAQTRSPFIRNEIRLFTGCEASLYGNIAAGGVIRIISRKAISPLDSTFLTTEKSLDLSDSIRKENLQVILPEKFIPSFYPSSTEKNTSGIVFRYACDPTRLRNVSRSVLYRHPVTC